MPSAFQKNPSVSWENSRDKSSGEGKKKVTSFNREVASSGEE